MILNRSELSIHLHYTGCSPVEHRVLVLLARTDRSSMRDTRTGCRVTNLQWLGARGNPHYLRRPQNGLQDRLAGLFSQCCLVDKRYQNGTHVSYAHCNQLLTSRDPTCSTLPLSSLNVAVSESALSTKMACPKMPATPKMPNNPIPASNLKPTSCAISSTAA